MKLYKKIVIIITGIIILITGILTKQNALLMVPLFISLFVMGFQSEANRLGVLIGSINSLVYTGAYIYMGVYASAASAILFSFPIQLMTFFSWKKNAYKKTVVFKRMSNKVRLLFAAGVVALWAVTAYIFTLKNYQYAIWDSYLFIMGFVVPILTMLAYIEYTYLWIVNCIIGLFLNVQMVIVDYTTATYFIYGIYALYSVIGAYMSVQRFYREQQNITPKKMKLWKKIIAITLAVILSLGGLFITVKDDLLYPEYEMTDSIKFAQSLGRGWNLGNTLEACEKFSSEKMGLESETMWGNPETTKELLQYVKDCGFDSIRLPVTWAQHLGDAPDYTIDKEWLDRVNTVVDWCYELDMKVIINVHHDDAFWLITDNAHKAEATDILTKIWAQLCERFKDYDENLVFETMNEPRVANAEDEWYGNDESREVVNHLNFAALETIRSGGGYNATRYVMIPTYAASGLPENVNALKLPDDDRVMISVHYYYGTAHQSEFKDAEKAWGNISKLELYKILRNIHEAYIDKGYGVVLGEFGYTDRDNIENLATNTRFYVELAEKLGFSCLVWDNGESFMLIDRKNLSQKYPQYIEAIVGK